ncbi:hypothetical protein K402DRAFT_464379 [Aulographum hederae CBS 113979]|uniref:Uncharacterized protein n=1 Tax=Aulographum hederae CBS 113979 TaxID=1176131 RepID=A0A6G1GX34_9PEZI|nr:hypothetical protein K402DRAFT_464379 [Aulographum hederae CBS 113979]
MAPRRGGGGSSSGGSSSGSSTENQCEYTDAFEFWYNIAILVVFPIFFLVFCGLFWYYLRVRKNNPVARKILRFPTFGFALLFVIIAIILFIINSVLQDCYVGSFYAYNALAYTTYILSICYAFFLLAVIVHPLCSALLKHVDRRYKLVQGIHDGTLAVMAVIIGAAIIITGLNLWSTLMETLPGVAGLSATWDVLFLVLSMSASAVMIYCLLSAKGVHSSKGLKVWIPLLVTFFLIRSLLNVIERFLFEIANIYLTIDGSYQLNLAEWILEFILIAGMFFCTLKIAASDALLHSHGADAGGFESIHMQPQKIDNAAFLTGNTENPGRLQQDLPQYAPPQDQQQQQNYQNGYQQPPVLQHYHTQPQQQQQQWPQASEAGSSPIHEAPGVVRPLYEAPPNYAPGVAR